MSWIVEKLNELAYGKPFLQCLAHSKQSINITYYYYRALPNWIQTFTASLQSANIYAPTKFGCFVCLALPLMGAYSQVGDR